MIASPARLIVPLLAGGLLALTGCGTYRDATAYFNTYYNASKLYDEAMVELNKSPQTARDSNYFAPYNISPALATKFEKVIEKASKVIQFHSESGYVEDAIMMIGKSYLYQNETGSAAKKFRELVDNFPGSDRRAEAALWYAKTLYQGSKDDEALTVAKELSTPGADRADLDLPGDVLLEITMLQAQIYTDRGEYAQAAATLDRINALDGDGEIKAFAQYQLGTVYELTKEYEKAAEAYNLVGDYSPTQTMSFNAKIREGVMLSQAGEPEAALETFDAVLAWPLKIEQSALVDIEIANAYWVLGDSAAAFTLYAIIDSTFQRTDAAARSFFKRGEIMEKHYRDLPQARKYYEKAKSEYPSSPVAPLALARFTSLDHFLRTQDRLRMDDSALQAMLNPVDTLADGDSTGTVAMDSTMEQADSSGAGRPMFSLGRDPDVPPTIVPPKEQPVRPEQAELRPAPGGPVENLSMRLIRSRPRHLVPDPEEPGEQGPGGGPATIPEDPGTALAARMKDEPAKPETKESGNAEPMAPATLEELRRRIAEGEYELAGIFLLDLDMPDSALAYYERLVTEYPLSPLVPKAIYAMSEAHRILGDTVAVDSLYDLLLSAHPETEYAHQVKKYRGLDTSNADESPDAIRYREAEAALFSGDSERALESFKQLAAIATDSAVAPKSHYTVGWIYENVLIDLDSAEAWYKALIKEYPGSAYALNAEPRVVVRGDTTKLGLYVKSKKIDAVPKPQKKSIGQIPKEGGAGRGTIPGAPGEQNKPPVNPDDDEYFNPGEDEEEPEEPDAGDEDVEEPDDDPGRRRNRP